MDEEIAQITNADGIPGDTEVIFEFDEEIAKINKAGEIEERDEPAVSDYYSEITSQQTEEDQSYVRIDLSVPVEVTVLFALFDII